VRREISGLWCGEHRLSSAVHEEQAAERHSAHQGEQRYRLSAEECQANLSAGGRYSGSDLEKGKSVLSSFRLATHKDYDFFGKLEDRTAILSIIMKRDACCAIEIFHFS